MDMIERDARKSISQQIAEIIHFDICRGVYQPGRRLPGERVLAKRFNVNRKTIAEAIELLEADDYVETLPAKGCFVADDVMHELASIKIALPFPEPSISSEYIPSLETQFSVSEFHAGIIAESVKLNAHVDLFHMSMPQNEIQMRRSIRKLEHYDGAIFISDMLSNVRTQCVKDGKPSVSLPPAGSESRDYACVTYSRENAFHRLAQELASRGIKKIGVLRQDQPDDIWKTETLKRCIKDLGGELQPEYIYTVKIPTAWDELPNTLEEIIPTAKSALPEIFFCCHAEFPVALWKMAYGRGWMPGRDVNACGLASGITFRNMTPAIGYMKIPCYEMGRFACRLLAKIITDDNALVKQEILEAEFVEGRMRNKTGAEI